MDLSDAFLDVDPDKWEPREDYRKALAVLKAMNVVNDHAERGVALIQEYSGVITKDESQQYLLQIVQKYRQKYPDCRKQTLVDQEPLEYYSELLWFWGLTRKWCCCVHVVCCD